GQPDEGPGLETQLDQFLACHEVNASGAWGVQSTQANAWLPGGVSPQESAPRRGTCEALAFCVQQHARRPPAGRRRGDAMHEMETFAALARWAGRTFALNLGYLPGEKLEWKPAPGARS